MKHIHKTKESTYITSDEQPYVVKVISKDQVQLKGDNLSYLDILIKEQKRNNLQLRDLSDKLHQLVKGLNGEFPREIYKYDEKEEEIDLAYLERLSINSVYYKTLIEDIEYSIHHLENYIK